MSGLMTIVATRVSFHGEIWETSYLNNFLLSMNYTCFYSYHVSICCTSYCLYIDLPNLSNLSSLSIYRSISFYIFIYLYIYLSIYLSKSFYIFIYLFIYLSIYLSIYLYNPKLLHDIGYLSSSILKNYKSFNLFSTKR